MHKWQVQGGPHPYSPWVQSLDQGGQDPAALPAVQLMKIKAALTGHSKGKLSCSTPVF